MSHRHDAAVRTIINWHVGDMLLVRVVEVALFDEPMIVDLFVRRYLERNLGTADRVLVVVSVVGPLSWFAWTRRRVRDSIDAQLESLLNVPHGTRFESLVVKA